MAVRLERVTGERLKRHLTDLAKLRIEVFREFPYLYEGSLDYEQRYLQTYAEVADSVIIGAFDGEDLVGAATALPLRHEPDELIQPFVARGHAIDEIFYFGESVLRRSYRGQGIGVGFFREREAAALGHPEIRFTTFCAVVRAPDHPRRPADYVPLSEFWRRRGYRMVDGLIGTLAWRDLDEAEPSAKPMQFWIKSLR